MKYLRYFAARYAKKINLAMLNLTIYPKNYNNLVIKNSYFACIFGELAEKPLFYANFKALINSHFLYIDGLVTDRKLNHE